MLFLASVRWHCHGILPTSCVKFGLWQDTYSKLQILPITFDGDALFELSLLLPKCLQPFPNARHGQKVQRPCLVQANHNQYQK
jgi:hypothetical protein